MIEVFPTAALVGVLVAELAWRLVPFMNMDQHLRDLGSFFEHFKRTAGDDDARERLLRYAGWRILKIGLTKLLILGAATALVCAVPWLQDWSVNQWLQYSVALTLAAVVWWAGRYWTRPAKP